MKKVINILLALALPVVFLSGCNKFDDEKFDESSSERVQSLIDDAYSVLTSSEEGWYFESTQGWNDGTGKGVYWFWCKFNDDYTVEAAAEFAIMGAEQIAPGTPVKSDFDLIRGRGAVLSFDVYNTVLHYWSDPDLSPPDGKEGDYEFSIVEVTPDIVTVKGIKTEKIMRFHRKADGLSVVDGLKMYADSGAKLDNVAMFDPVSVEGAYVNDEWGYAPSVNISKRSLTVIYDIFQKMVEKEVEVSEGVYEMMMAPQTEPMEVNFQLSPISDGSGFSLLEPVTVAGNVITGFTWNETNDVLTSNDPGQTIVLEKYVWEGVSITMDDIVGTYAQTGVDVYGGAANFFGITIEQTNTNTVEVTGLGGYPFWFEATVDLENRVMIAQNMQDTGYSESVSGNSIYFLNFEGDAPVVFSILRPGLIVSRYEWGYKFGDNVFNAAGWQSTTFTRN